MDNLDLIPEVLDNNPVNILDVKFQGRLLKPGDILQPTCVKLIPQLEWQDNKRSLYTICMIDPDAPSKNDPKFREFLHWLVINAPLNKVKDGTTMAGYIGACPQKGTGLHRYLILVFKQKKKIISEETRISEHSTFGRAKFSNKAFVRKYNLGPLIAGNIFLSEWDDYVPKLQKRLEYCTSH